jgi:hypothetical protein
MDIADQLIELEQCQVQAVSEEFFHFWHRVERRRRSCLLSDFDTLRPRQMSGLGGKQQRSADVCDGHR